MLAFDTGPGRGDDRRASRGWSTAGARYDRDGLIAAQGRPDEARARASCWPIRSSRAPPPKSTGRERFGDAYAARAARAGARRRTASPPRSSSPRGPSPSGRAAGRRPAPRSWPPAAAATIPGSWPRSSAGSRRPGGHRAPTVRRPLLPRRRQGSGRVRPARLSHTARAARQRSRRYRRERRPRARHGDARMSTGSAMPESGRLILPALRARRATAASPTRPAASPTRSSSASAASSSSAARVESVRRLTADLLRRAGRPLLIAADLERGAGQQVAGLTEFPPPLALASLGRLRRGALGRRRSRRRRRAPWASTGSLRRWRTSTCCRRTRSCRRGPSAPIPNRVASLRPHLDRGLPGRGRAGLRQALSRGTGAPRSTRTSPCRWWSDSRGHAARQRPAAVHRRRRERRGVDHDRPRGLSGARSPPACRPRSPAPIMGELRERLGFDGLVVTDALIMDGALVGPARVGRRGRGGPGRGGPAALSQRPAARARRARAGARERRRSRRRGWRSRSAATTARSPLATSADAAGHPRPVRVGRRAGRRAAGAGDAARRRPDAPRPARSGGGRRRPGRPVPAGPERLRPPGARRRAASGATTAGRGWCWRSPSRGPGRGGPASAPPRATRWRNAVPGADLIVLFGHPRLLPELPDATRRCCWRGTASG